MSGLFEQLVFPDKFSLPNKYVCCQMFIWFQENTLVAEMIVLCATNSSFWMVSKSSMEKS